MTAMMAVADINRVEFHFDPKIGIISGVMVAIMVFSVALDLRWSQFERIMRRPLAPAIGLIGQFFILPALSYVIGRFMIDTPSVALGLLLVASCPGGSMSNYLSHLAHGDVATSVAMSAVSTVTAVVMTPLIFAVLASANPATKDLLREVGVDPVNLLLMFTVTIVLPVIAGMTLATRRPVLTAKLRPWLLRLSMLLFAFSVVAVVGSNFGMLVDFAHEALVPAGICFASGLLLGWVSGRLVRLTEPERRAVAIEVGGQNITLAIAISITFFPSLAGMAVMSVCYGVTQILIGVPLIAIWNRVPPRDAPTA